MVRRHPQYGQRNVRRVQQLWARIFAARRAPSELQHAADGTYFDPVHPWQQLQERVVGRHQLS